MDCVTIKYCWLSLQNKGLFTEFAYITLNFIYIYYSKDLALHIINFITKEGSKPP
jgi:hypothetical protein